MVHVSVFIGAFHRYLIQILVKLRVKVRPFVSGRNVKLRKPNLNPSRDKKFT